MFFNFGGLLALLFTLFSLQSMLSTLPNYGNETLVALAGCTGSAISKLIKEYSSLFSNEASVAAVFRSPARPAARHRERAPSARDACGSDWPEKR